MQTCKLTQSYGRCWERMPVSVSPRKRLPHRAQLHRHSSDILKGGVGVTLACDQQMQVQIGLLVSSRSFLNRL